MANGGFPDILCGVWGNQHVNRIADGIDAQKHKQGHGQHDKASLNETLNDIPKH
jgi:hypothetical protein